MSLLETSLSQQKLSSVQALVQTQFRGEYAYVTKCLKCKKENLTPSFFYELDLTLQGKKTLADCLSDFTKDEKLTGDNQYFCVGCNGKQDATRGLRLKELPPVLNLQLNRFIFDMQTGNKKKLNSFVQFPEELDMSKYLRDGSHKFLIIYPSFFYL
jgi:ubiquitin carboxyl-terminal hydrolase 48